MTDEPKEIEGLYTVKKTRESVRIKIQDKAERQNMIVILVGNGYKVWLEVEKPYSYSSTDYFVCFEV